MMKLSTMYKVDCMVDTNGQNPVAEQLMKRWEHEQGSARFFRSSANFVYVFRNEGRQNFLRFAESSERTRKTIEAEMDILHWVARRGMTVTTPIQSRNGHFVETVVTELGTFHAVGFAGLEGSQLDIGELDDSQFREWGAALGKLHAALRTYAGPGLSTRSTWKDHLEMVRAFLPQNESTLWIECEQIASSLQGLPMTPENYGLVHFDFELDNLYWLDHTIGIGGPASVRRAGLRGADRRRRPADRRHHRVAGSAEALRADGGDLRTRRSLRYRLGSSRPFWRRYRSEQEVVPRVCPRIFRTVST